MCFNLRDIFKIILWLIFIMGCKESAEEGGNCTGKSLKGALYGVCDTIDSQGVGKPIATDYFFQIGFVDDSVFVIQIFNCCMPSTRSYFTGIYRFDERVLHIKYDSIGFMHSEEIKLGEGYGIPDEPASLEMIVVDVIDEVWQMEGCQGRPYFKMKDEDWGKFKIAFMSNDIKSVVDAAKKDQERLCLKPQKNNRNLW